MSVKVTDIFRATRARSVPSFAKSCFQFLYKRNLLSLAVITTAGVPLCVHMERAGTEVKTASVVLAVPVPCHVSEEDNWRLVSLVYKWAGFTGLSRRYQNAKFTLQLQNIE